MRESKYHDLVAFLRDWPLNRPIILGLTKRPDMTDAEKDILEIMIFIMDRTRPDDLMD